MSDLIKKNEVREFSHYVQTEEGKLWYVDSALCLDNGYETMVFKYENGRIDFGKVRYTEHYENYEEMAKGHERICYLLEEFCDHEY